MGSAESNQDATFDDENDNEKKTRNIELTQEQEVPNISLTYIKSPESHKDIKKEMGPIREVTEEMGSCNKVVPQLGSPPGHNEIQVAGVYSAE